MKSTFANQNIFEINRDMPAKGAKRPYIAIYNDNLFGAMQELSGEAAIKLYIYLAANQNGFNLNFSPKLSYPLLVFSHQQGCNIHNDIRLDRRTLQHCFHNT